MWTGKTARGWGRWWDRVLSLPSPCSPHLPLFLLIFSRSLTSHHTLLSKRLDQASIPLIYLSFLDFVWERDMSHIQERQFYRKVFSLVNNIFQPSFFLNRTLHVLECTSCSCVKLKFLMCGALIYVTIFVNWDSENTLTFTKYFVFSCSCFLFPVNEIPRTRRLIAITLQANWRGRGKVRSRFRCRRCVPFLPP